MWPQKLNNINTPKTLQLRTLASKNKMIKSKLLLQASLKISLIKLVTKTKFRRRVFLSRHLDWSSTHGPMVQPLVPVSTFHP